MQAEQAMTQTMTARSGTLKEKAFELQPRVNLRRTTVAGEGERVRLKRKRHTGQDAMYAATEGKKKEHMVVCRVCMKEDPEQTVRAKEQAIFFLGRRVSASIRLWARSSRPSRPLSLHSLAMSSRLACREEFARRWSDR